jgi:hypothetical protein
MLELAETKDWQQIAELDRQRRTLIEQALAAGVALEEKGQVVSLLQEIKALTDGLVQKGQSGKTEVEEAMRLLQRQKTASAAYDACQHTEP